MAVVPNSWPQKGSPKPVGDVMVGLHVATAQGEKGKRHYGCEGTEA